MDVETETGPGHPKRSLFRRAPVPGAVLAIMSAALSGVSFAFCCRYQTPYPERSIGLSALYVVLTTASMALSLTWPSIREPPKHVSKTSIFFVSWWTALQTAGFVAISFMWRDSWEETLKHLCQAWMFLSFTSISVWTASLLVIIAKAGLEGQRRERSGSGTASKTGMEEC